MPKVKIDSTFAQTARCPPGKAKVTYWDETIPGFVLEVRPNGSGTYALRFTDAHGVQRQHRIGSLGIMTLDTAKKAARRLRSEVELGDNPAQRKAEKRAVPTYNELADQHYRHGKTYLRRPRDLETVLRRHIRPRWGKVRIDGIDPQAIALWLSELRERGLAPSTVEKVRVTFHRSFELAIKWGIFGAARNPVHAVPRPKFNNKRERYLTASEADRLVKACGNSANTQLKSIVLLLMLTGARKMELLRAKWEHVDLERKTWHIPDSKTGRPRYVPLSMAAVAVIENLPRWENCSWLIANPKTRKPFVCIKHPFDTARKAAGLSDLRIHDLRHTAASFMINAGTDLFTVGKVLGHSDYQSTMRYSHLTNETLMKAVEAGAAKMFGGVA